MMGDRGVDEASVTAARSKHNTEAAPDKDHTFSPIEICQTEKLSE